MASVSKPRIDDFPEFYMPQYFCGGALIWVCNRTGMPAGDGSRRDYPISSIFGAGGAIAKLASYDKVQNKADGLGGTIIVLPGHSENIAASTSLTTLAGSATTMCNIIGVGTGASRPTINWTAAASALLINQAGFWFRNMAWNMNKTAATVVTAAVTVSAADCGLEDIDFLPNTSATQLTTTAFTIATGATRFTCNRVNGYGETFATNPTDIFTTTAAVDKLTVTNSNFFVALNATTNGAINLANAPTNINFQNNVFMNKKVSSTIAGVASASTTGSMVFCNFAITNATGGATAMGTPGNINMTNCFGGVVGKNAIAITPQSG